MTETVKTQVRAPRIPTSLPSLSKRTRRMKMSCPRIRRLGTMPKPEHFLPLCGSSQFCNSLACSKFSWRLSDGERVLEAASTLRRFSDSDEGCKQPIMPINEMQSRGRSKEKPSKRQILEKVLGRVHPSRMFSSARPRLQVGRLSDQFLNYWMRLRPYPLLDLALGK